MHWFISIYWAATLWIYWASSIFCHCYPAHHCIPTNDYCMKVLTLWLVLNMSSVTKTNHNSHYHSRLNPYHWWDNEGNRWSWKKKKKTVIVAFPPKKNLHQTALRCNELNKKSSSMQRTVYTCSNKPQYKKIFLLLTTNCMGRSCQLLENSIWNSQADRQSVVWNIFDRVSIWN